MSGASFQTTVDACLEWLGEDVETIARHPGQTLVPPSPGRKESWERADALLVERLAGDTPLVLKGTLGQGGEGVVREAEQRSLGRLVAVKTLQGRSPAPGAALSLLREAWLLGSLEHPNILPVHDLRRDESGLPQVVLKRIGPPGATSSTASNDPKRASTESCSNPSSRCCYRSARPYASPTAVGSCIAISSRPTS